MAKLILLFTLVPLVELYLLFRVAEYIGGGTTVLIVALTGFLGVILAKYQGLKVLKDTLFALSSGQMPAHNLLDGLFILIGGAFLLTPGLLTDALGFSLLFPITRKKYKEYAIKKLQRMIQSGNIFIYRR
ncbi:FxsA family protein [Anaerobranca gottschalkii]|uniref:UPF0716 protein FxsA n=1 Tax=Anaerobranca gottschalkii DSM 13577 TaxID=1120990 RepID=A0A1I0CM23_9FIRM|nr:FxsA family protein [Anaerobranca gottschalkii]SET20274.1 UPF0716 protein FxsA [Anaerobranca gottschalkii DSM 13577]